MLIEDKENILDLVIMPLRNEIHQGIETVQSGNDTDCDSKRGNGY